MTVSLAALARNRAPPSGCNATAGCGWSFREPRASLTLGCWPAASGPTPGGWHGSERPAARTSARSRCETAGLTREATLKGLALRHGDWRERVMAPAVHQRVILDVDRAERPVSGQQAGAASHGPCECGCWFELTPLSPSRRGTTGWSSGPSALPSGFRPTRCSGSASGPCWRDPLRGQPRSPASCTTTSRIRPNAGMFRGEEGPWGG